MILLYAHSLLRGVTFKVLPLSSYAFIPTMLPLLETFQEQLSGPSSHFFWMFSVSWRQILF